MTGREKGKKGGETYFDDIGEEFGLGTDQTVQYSGDMFILFALDQEFHEQCECFVFKKAV